MSGCANRRWGVSASSAACRPDTTSKEADAALQKILAERARQDSMWYKVEPHRAEPEPQPEKPAPKAETPKW